MADKLAAEIMDAFNNQGGAFKRIGTDNEPGNSWPGLTLSLNLSQLSAGL